MQGTVTGAGEAAWTVGISGEIAEHSHGYPRAQPGTADLLKSVGRLEFSRVAVGDEMSESL